jgi:hypothetical protein
VFVAREMEHRIERQDGIESATRKVRSREIAFDKIGSRNTSPTGLQPVAARPPATYVSGVS